MLSVDGLDVAIGPVPILRQVALAVPPGAMCGLIGRNGAGKTTLLRAVMGLLPAQSGSVRVAGEEMLSRRGFARARLGIGYMPEDRKLVPALTAEENVLLPAWATGIADHRARLARIYDLIPELREFRDRPSTSLSGGQQKMVALGRALMVGERLLLLDEPTEGIAPILARRMVDVLANLKAEGRSVLVAESNDTHLLGLLDRTYVIERGNVRCQEEATVG
jgi:branched-chain amino acid transport system ATP-binding protein